MTRLSSVRAVPLLLTFAIAACTRAQGLAAPAGSTARVDSLFAEWNTDSTPGCAVGVVRNGRAVLERAYGMANLEYGVRNGAETIFEAGSVAKQFTAAAVVVLAQQGKLSLEDDVRRYLPELPDYGHRITLRHMLNHTSGLRDWGSVVSAAGWPRGTRAHTHEHVLDIVARQRSLNFAPGSEYLYSNTGYNLMAILVARVSGQSFAEFTERHLFAPLGMTHTQWRDDYTRVVRGRATAYARDGDGFRSAMPFENVHGNGGLLTTIADLHRWNENFVQGKVGAAWLADSLQRRGRLTSGRQIEYALGLTVSSRNGVPEISHTGSTAGYRAALLRYPEQHLSLALLCNVANINPGVLARRVADIFLDARRTSDTAVTAVRVPRQELEARAGLYRNTRTGDPVRVLVRDSLLDLEDGPLLVPIGNAVFRMQGSETRVQFASAPDGKRATMLTIARDGDTVHFEPVAVARPTVRQLAEYVGDYHSDEAETTLTLAMRGDSLVVRRRPDVERALVPAYADAFTIPDVGLVRFIRGHNGRITALSLGLGRVRDLRFARLEEAGSG